MRILSARILVPAAAVVVAWGGAHLLSTRNDLAVQPAVWPVSAPPNPSAGPAAPHTPAAPVGSASPGPSPAPPLLPGLMQRLNGDTRDTALGMYAVIGQLERALGDRLRQLVQQLEPGR